MTRDRATELFEDAHRAICVGTDRLFVGLLLLEWVFAGVIALWVTPGTWLGAPAPAYRHVLTALLVSGAFIWPAVAVALMRPGARATRLIIAIAQALTSAHLIHLTGGRIETHFHIFGSLAFLSFYRDWRVLVVASGVVGLDHYLRGTFLPASVFGMHHVEPWRWLEHTGWVVFTDVFLIAAGRQSLREMRRLAAREAAIQFERDAFEQRVIERTASLAASEDRFRSLSEASPVGVFHLDRTGRCVYVNRRWEQMFERSPAPADHWTDVLHEDDRGGARAIWDSAVAERAALPEIVCRFGAAEDAERWVAVRAEPVSHDQGALDGYVGIAADITEPKRSAMALAAAKAAAESANAVKSEFLAHMSHEMRTPLNGIVGMTALALDGELTADQRDCLETVQGSAESLLTLVGDVLDFSRLEAARLPLRVRSFDLRETIARTLKPLAIRAAHRGLELRHAIDPETPDQLSGDADRLRQVLINLVANAIKFTEAGRIDVAIASRPGADGSVVVSFAVTDTGIGIPLDKQRIIFAPFEQVDGSLTRTHDGTGLGLAIAAKLVALMGGEMSVDSTLGRGSTFRFTARLTPEASSAVAIPAAALAPAATITPLHVLVVDDNEVNRRIALRMLRKLGHTAVEAENGRLALAALEDDDYDLVLMDIQMPEMDGLAATTAIRERERDSGVHVPIVALTAHALENDRTMCLAAGMDGHLTKPLTVKALTTAIAQSMSAAAAPAVARLPQQRVASVVCLGPPVSGRDAALSGVRA